MRAREGAGRGRKKRKDGSLPTSSVYLVFSIREWHIRAMVKQPARGAARPFPLSFDEIERALGKSHRESKSDGYPPYNIERVASSDAVPEMLRITLAVAGFSRDQIEVTQEDNDLTIRGHRKENEPDSYLPRGIVKQQFQRRFLLAEGMKIMDVAFSSSDGVLTINLGRSPTNKAAKMIDVSVNGYIIVGRLSDGVDILCPKSKPDHFTPEQIKSTIQELQNAAKTARFVNLESRRA